MHPPAASSDRDAAVSEVDAILAYLRRPPAQHEVVSVRGPTGSIEIDRVTMILEDGGSARVLGVEPGGSVESAKISEALIQVKGRASELLLFDALASSLRAEPFDAGRAKKALEVVLDAAPGAIPYLGRALAFLGIRP